MILDGKIKELMNLDINLDELFESNIVWEQFTHPDFKLSGKDHLISWSTPENPVDLLISFDEKGRSTTHVKEVTTKLDFVCVQDEGDKTVLTELEGTTMRELMNNDFLKLLTEKRVLSYYGQEFMKNIIQHEYF
jgi:hypothetical protein